MKHSHDRYRCHPVSRRHRPLRLDVEYPIVTPFLRHEAIVNMPTWEFHWRYVSDDLFKKTVQKARKIMGLVKREGGPIEIYLRVLLRRTAKTVRESKLPFTDQVLLEQFMDEHFIVHIHEVLHRMWQWESTFNENRGRSPLSQAGKVEEMTVTDFALWIRNILNVKPQYTDSVWKQFCEKYRMLNQHWYAVS